MKLAIILSIIYTSILSALGLKSLKSKQEKTVEFQVINYGTLSIGQLVAENILEELPYEYYIVPTMLKIEIKDKSYTKISLIQKVAEAEAKTPNPTKGSHKTTKTTSTPGTMQKKVIAQTTKKDTPNASIQTSIKIKEILTIAPPTSRNILVDIINDKAGHPFLRLIFESTQFIFKLAPKDKDRASSISGVLNANLTFYKNKSFDEDLKKTNDDYINSIAWVTKLASLSNKLPIKTQQGDFLEVEKSENTKLRKAINVNQEILFFDVAGYEEIADYTQPISDISSVLIKNKEELANTFKGIFNVLVISDPTDLKQSILRIGNRDVSFKSFIMSDYKEEDNFIYMQIIIEKSNTFFC
jgi:hypothetical protein